MPRDEKITSSKFLQFFWVVAILGIVVFFGIRFYFSKQPAVRLTDVEVLRDAQVYQFGAVRADRDLREISFSGIVVRDQGEVQFLIHLQGYQWLEPESAIVSLAKLGDLQNAMASIDWEAWEEIIHQASGYEQETTYEERVSVAIRQNGREIPAQRLVLAEEALRFSDFIFPGSVYFDSVVLQAGGSQGNCAQCPLFPLEQKIISEAFIRASGESGYRINEQAFPKGGQEVTVLIRIANPDKMKE